MLVSNVIFFFIVLMPWAILVWTSSAEFSLIVDVLYNMLCGISSCYYACTLMISEYSQLFSVTERCMLMLQGCPSES